MPKGRVTLALCRSAILRSPRVGRSKRHLGDAAQPNLGNSAKYSGTRSRGALRHAGVSTHKCIKRTLANHWRPREPSHRRVTRDALRCRRGTIPSEARVHSINSGNGPRGSHRPMGASDCRAWHAQDGARRARTPARGDSTGLSGSPGHWALAKSPDRE